MNAVEHALSVLKELKLTAAQLLISVLEGSTPACARHATECFPSEAGPNDGTRSLLDALRNNSRTRNSTENWVQATATELALRDVRRLTAVESGFHFSTRAVTAQDILRFDIDVYAAKLEKTAPFLWRLAQQLLDSNGFLHVQLQKYAAARSVAPAAAIEGSASRTTSLNDLLFEDLTAEDLEWFPDQPDAPSPAQETARRDRALERLVAIKHVKCVAILSIFMQSSHFRCLQFAATLGFNMQSRLTPEVVVEMYAHLGLSVSPSSLVNMTTTLARESSSKVRKAADERVVQMAYDNQDIGTPAAQPTLEKPGAFHSLTSATFLIVQHCDADDLAVSEELWEKSELNPARPLGAPPPYRVNYRDIIMLLPDPGPDATANDAHCAQFSFPLLQILLTQRPAFSHFRTELGTEPPGSSHLPKIPVTRTEQFPARTMEYNAGTVDAQWDILRNLLTQAGFPDDPEPILKKYCILVHGDLGMLEKVESLQISRAIEDSAFTRLQWVLGIPGLFHTRMACAEAVWRTHLKPSSGRPDDEHSIWHLAGILRPHETGRLSSKPSFRLLHDVITHLTWAIVIECWERVLSPEFSSLDEFAKSKPTWDQLQKLADQVALEFVAGEDFSANRRRGAQQRDGVREDVSLFLREGLLYISLGDFTARGYIGRVEENLAHWIPIFAAVGKHKYASALSKFLTSLRHVLPPRAAHAVRMNWLCNPTGRPDGFRAVDWLVELNNMMQKTWYGGEGSHRTIEHMKKQSVLTEIYRGCVLQIEKTFHLTHRTVRHQPPDMVKTLARVTAHIREHDMVAFKPGRTSRQNIPDQFSAGLSKLQRQYGSLRTSEGAGDEDLEEDIRDTERDDGDLDLDLVI